MPDFYRIPILLFLDSAAWTFLPTLMEAGQPAMIGDLPESISSPFRFFSLPLMISFGSPHASLPPIFTSLISPFLQFIYLELLPSEG